MVNIQNLRIITICKLKAIGINDPKLNSKILKGSATFCKSVFNSKIRCKNISFKQIFNVLFDYDNFRISHYYCIKCNIKHYFKDNVWDNHYKHSKRLFGEQQRQNLVSETLDYMLKRYYNNNKNNKEFQRIIQFIDVILSKDNLDYMNNTLRSFVIKNYKTNILKTYNTKINEMNLKIQRNIKLLKQIIDHIDYINYFNEELMNKGDIEYNMTYQGRTLNVITGYKKINTLTDRLYMRKTADLYIYKFDRLNELYDLINSNKETKEIIDKLDITQGRINNKVVYNKILLLIEQYKEMLYDMNYGIKSYKKDTPEGKEIVGAIPYDNTGKFTSSFQNYERLNSVILYCYDKSKKYKGINNNTHKTGYKARINYIFKNEYLELLDKGKNLLRSTAKRYISYRMRNNPVLLQKIEDLKYNTYQHIEQCEQHITKHIKRIIRSYKKGSNTEYIDFIVKFDITENKVNYNMYDIDFNFDYNNKGNKTFKYNKYLKNLGIKRYMKGYMIFLPHYDNDDYLYCSFGHLMNPPKDPLSDIKDQTKLGNLRLEYIFRDKMHDDLYNWVWILTAKLSLRKLITYKNDTIIKNELIKLLNYSINKIQLNKYLKAYFIDILDNFNRKIKLRMNYIDDLSGKIIKHKVVYDNLESRRTKQGKHINKQIILIETRIDKQGRMLGILTKQHDDALKFFVNVVDKNKITDISKMIQNIFVMNIKQYYIKTLVRYVNTKRSQIELIKLGLNNMNYDLMYELDTKLTVNKPEIVYKDKFEELLNYNNNKNEIIKISDQICIPVKSLFTAYIKALRFDSNTNTVNVILDSIYEITQKFQNIESTILNT